MNKIVALGKLVQDTSLSSIDLIELFLFIQEENTRSLNDKNDLLTRVKNKTNAKFKTDPFEQHISAIYGDSEKHSKRSRKKSKDRTARWDWETHREDCDKKQSRNHKKIRKVKAELSGVFIDGVFQPL